MSNFGQKGDLGIIKHIANEENRRQYFAVD